MKPTELRIGNIVMYDNRVFRIHSLAEELPTLDTAEFGIGVVDWNNLEPVKINKEWLIKLGFKQIDDRWYHINGALEYDLDDNSIRLDDTLEFGKREYVHEIQNLYFELTREDMF